MFCIHCGKNNAEEASFCQFCGRALAASAETEAPIRGTAATPAQYPVRTRTSGLAIASLILGLLGLVTGGLSALVGLILGIIGLRQIQCSQGVLSGQGIAIGGIAVSGLLSLLLPALWYPIVHQSRQKAQATQCMSNMKQLGMALTMYSMDYDERYPMGKNWSDALAPYTKSLLSFQCPRFPGNRSAFAYNRELDRRTMGEFDSTAAKAVALFEAKGGWNLTADATLADPRHFDGLNITYVDGHVKWTRPDEAVVWKLGSQASPAAPTRGSRE